eukprot:6268134-Amphidinium_carterae.1
MLRRPICGGQARSFRVVRSCGIRIIIVHMRLRAFDHLPRFLSQIGGTCGEYILRMQPGHGLS